MRDFPQHFNSALMLMERVCPHGYAHPDPDDLAFKEQIHGWDPDVSVLAVHICDTCCHTPTEEKNVTEPTAVEELPEAILVDIDGTLARRVDRGPFDWRKVGGDEPITDVVELVKTLYWGSHAEIIFMSGRDVVCFDDTQEWLREHLGEWVLDLQLLMRPRKDGRKDFIVKEEIYRRDIQGKYNVRLVLDDRDQVVEMWRNTLGLTCLQVAPGDF
jgi:hypothetical protein